jgi:general secretion pathway protein G
MSKSINNRRVGFTLVELLLVLAIIVALFAILSTAVATVRHRSRINMAQTWVGKLGTALDTYTIDHGDYPTTEQGLNALIFIPINEGQAVLGMMPQPGMMNPNDPNAGGMNYGAGIAGGPDSFSNPAMSGVPGTVDPMMGNNGAMVTGGTPTMPMASGTTPGIPGDPNMMSGGMNDPMMSGMNPMGSGTTGFGTGWTQPMFNPQLYMPAKKRLDPYLNGDKIPLDPWNHPYRYQYDLFNGVNRVTGDRKPAIWSAGPDGIDNTEDDIRSWDPQVAANQLALQQQQMGGGGMMSGGFDAMGNPLQPGMMGNDMMNPNPMGTNPMNPNPMGTNPMNPNPMGTNPMNPNPNPMGPTPMQ